MARIAVLGAGIIGSAAATWLIDEGHEVTVYEPDIDGLPTSTGNAALLAFPEIAPIASPGIVTTVPKWLLDPLGPLTVRWTDLPALTPWLLAFLMNATPGQEARTRLALTGLMKTALADHEELGRKAGLAGHLRQTGYISVHDSEASTLAALREAEKVREALGYPYERVSVEKARELVPQLEGQFAGAVLQPIYWMVSNPLTVLRRYQAFWREKAQFVPSRAQALRQTDEGIAVVCGSGEDLYDKVVVASGVWSRELVRSLGVKVLLETERGYNTTYGFTELGWNLPMPVGFGDHGFIASPLVDGLRVGGAVELAKPQSPPNFGRARAMRTKMRRYVPSLPEGGKEWMGRRPSTPDSVPVISRHPKDDRIVFAFGHGHLGLTLSAVTARRVADLVAGRDTADLSPFDIARFQ
ncbi:D-amino acid dehydrogenase small subunit [Devosia sp. DBB001]|nr:D-amino acid dehydrogenase small subunit [Devosia sp. DBB001]